MSFSDKLKNWKKLYSVENIFLIMAILFGIAIAVIGTPFQECDGWSHFVRAVDVSYGNVLSPIVTLNHEGGVAVVPENFGEINYRTTEPGSGEGEAFKEDRTSTIFCSVSSFSFLLGS